MSRTLQRLEPAWLSLDQAAEVCGVSTKTVRRWISAGILPAYRLGPRVLRVNARDLETLGRLIPAGRVA